MKKNESLITSPFGDLLYKKRKEKEMTREQLAELLGEGVEPQKIYRWERAGILPNVTHHKKLAEFLGIEQDKILELDEIGQNRKDLLPLLRLILESNPDTVSRSEFEFLATEWEDKPLMGLELVKALLAYKRTQRLAKD